MANFSLTPPAKKKRTAAPRVIRTPADLRAGLEAYGTAGYPENRGYGGLALGPANQPLPRTPGGPGYTQPDPYPGYLTAEEQAGVASRATEAALAPIRQAIERQQQQAARDASSSGLAIQGFSTALAGLLGGIAPATEEAYRGAAGQAAQLAGGYSDAFRQAEQAQVAKLNELLAQQGSPQQVAATPAADVLYGLGGSLPAQTLLREGEAFAAAQRQLPATTLGRGQQDFTAGQFSAAEQQAGYGQQLIDVAGRAPGLVQTELDRLRAEQAALRSAAEDRQQRDYEFAAQLGLQQSQLGEQRRQFNQGLGLQQSQLAEQRRQFEKGLRSQTKERQDTLAEQRRQFEKGLRSQTQLTREQRKQATKEFDAQLAQRQLEFDLSDARAWDQLRNEQRQFDSTFSAQQLQAALDRGDANSAADWQRNQAETAALWQQADIMSRSGVAHWVKDGKVVPMRSDQGVLVPTPEGRAAAANEALAGLQEPDIALSATVGQWVDQYGRPIPGLKGKPLPKQIRSVDAQLSVALGQWVDAAGEPIPALAGKPVPQVAADQPKVDLRLSQALREWVDSTGAPVPGLASRPVPKPAAGKPRALTPAQRGKRQATAGRISAGAYNGWTETRTGSGYPGPGWEPVRDEESPNKTIIGWQRAHPSLDYAQAMGELVTKGDPDTGPYPPDEARKILNQYYKRGERGRPMLDPDERRVVAAGARGPLTGPAATRAVRLLRSVFRISTRQAHRLLETWGTNVPADFDPKILGPGYFGE